jgi:hypothetical protein
LVETCAKFKKHLRRLCNKMRADMCISMVSTIYVGCFSQLSIWHFGSCFTKKTLFWHSKNGKSTFCGTKRKLAFVVFLYIPRDTHVSDMASFQQTMTCPWPNLAHLT